MKDIFTGSKRHDLLNGKCLEAYLEWYRDVYSVEHDINDNGWSVNYMSFQMAYGVYLEFFISINVIIDIQPLLDYDENTYIKVMYWSSRVIPLNTEMNNYYSDDKEIASLGEAQEQAIMEANRLYNTNFGNKS